MLHAAVDLTSLANLLIAFLAFFASLFFPLFIVPQLLLRWGLRPWLTRLVGWVVFMILITLVVTYLGVADVTHWSFWAVLAALALAALWDIRMTRRRSQQDLSPKS